MSYSPQPGTIAYRALAHFQNEPGLELTLSMLCERLGIEAGGAWSYLDALITHRLIDKFTKHGQARPFWLRLHRDETHQADHASAHECVAVPNALVAQLSKPAQRAIAEGVDVEEAIAPRYEPVDGSIPDRALAHLRSLPAGTELSTAQLSAAIGCESDRLTASLCRVVKSGALVIRRNLESLQNYFSLPSPRKAWPDGVDIDRANRVADSIQMDSNGATRPVASIARSEAAPAAQPPKQRAGHAEERPAQGDDFRAARWDDDTVVITKGNTVLELTPGETKRLARLFGVVS